MAVNYDRLLAHLKLEEGCNLQRHLVQGVAHIGYGRSLDTYGMSDEELEHLGYEDEDDIEQITQEQAEYLLMNNITEAEEWAKNVCDYWDELSPLRQEMMVSMAFNLGERGFSKFRRMHSALRTGGYEEAAKQMLDSSAAKLQAPNRYRRMAEAVATNNESALELNETFDDAPLPTATESGSIEDRIANLEAGQEKIIETLSALVTILNKE